MNSEIISLFNFIKEAKTPYHTVDLIRSKLVAHGFTELCERDEWLLTDGGKYFTVRAHSSIIALVYRKDSTGFNIVATHSDQPSLKVKGASEGDYLRLCTERYGGMLNYTWLDRALNVSGRVVVREGDALVSRLVTLSKTALIPSVAIHLNRKANEGLTLDPKKDLLALFSLSGSFDEILADELCVAKDDIISHDLYLVSADEPRLSGARDELILSPRLDDLECVCASVAAFLDGDNGNCERTNVLAVFNNEEVGSETRQGAASTFLYDVLYRTCADRNEYIRLVANSFMLSADNAHALHPNSPELSDAMNAPRLSSGVVIKHNSNQRYTTDAESCAALCELLSKNAVKYSHYYNRADIAGGSTLGSISNTRVSVLTVDIGAPQLAMHSIVETANTDDYIEMLRAMSVFYGSKINICKDMIIFD